MKNLQYILDEGIMDMTGDIGTVSKGLEDTISIDKINDGLRDKDALFWGLTRKFSNNIRNNIPNSYNYGGSGTDAGLVYTGAYEEGGKYKFKMRSDLYLNPSFKEQLDRDVFLGVKINEIVTENQIAIDDIQNINPDTTYPVLTLKNRMYMLDVRNIKDMDIEFEGGGSLLYIDTMYPVLTISNTKIMFNNSSVKGRLVFNGTSIPVLNNVESNCESIGISNDDLFTNRKNRKLIDMFDWSKVWEYPDGKRVVVKDINTLHTIVKFIRKQYKDDYNKPYYQKSAGYTPDIPLSIAKGAKVSDFINISKMPNLARIKIAEDVLMFEFIKGSDQSSYNGIVIGDTADGWKVLMTTDVSNERYSYKYW